MKRLIADKPHCYPRALHMSSIACLTTQKLDCDACNMMPRAGTKDRSCGVGSSKGLCEFCRLVLRGAAVAEIQWAAPVERANRRKAIGGFYGPDKLKVPAHQPPFPFSSTLRRLLQLRFRSKPLFAPRHRNIDRSASNRRTATTERAL